MDTGSFDPSERPSSWYQVLKRHHDAGTLHEEVARLSNKRFSVVKNIASLDILDAKLLGPARQEFVELRLGGPDNLVLQHLYQPVD